MYIVKSGYKKAYERKTEEELGQTGDVTNVNDIKQFKDMWKKAMETKHPTKS